MCDLKGLWCFYIGQGGRQWQKSASTDPRWHTHTHNLSPSLSLPASSLALSRLFLYTDMHGQTYACTQTCTFSHKLTLLCMNTHTPGPSSPIPTPLVALLASVCVSCVEGHQDIPQPAPRVCSAAWNRLGFQHNCPHWTRTSGATLCYS